MIQCTSCGTSLNGDVSTCSRCGAVLRPSPATDETVALANVESSRPRSTSSVSRLSITSLPEEGQFLAGHLVAGRYRIIGLLGRGGMGEVYRATDLTLAQSVALKFLPEDAATNERLLERFHNEVRIARQVSHPNVCRVYDIGEAEGLPFISMEYIDGEDLASLLQRIGRLPSDKALEIARKLCAGLAAAHERGVIHRDLKPQNVMLNKRGEVVIMDFGLAAVANELEGLEARNGTPAYMSPEQLRGASVTAKSDIYALGLIIYELFTGKRAYEAASMADLVRMQETTRPSSISAIAADVDPVVEKVILRCLELDPARRPATPLAVAAALPGGDPLAAALAAGETPSPELVAASGKVEGFRLRYAVASLVFVLVGLIAYPFAVQRISALAMTPMEYSPDVLEQKGREIAQRWGYPAKPMDWKSAFSWNRDLTYFESHPHKNSSWRQIFEAESPVAFDYRQSPRYLISPPDGEITLDRPPLSTPGMVNMKLDSRGRLRQFEAVAPMYGEGTTAVAKDVDSGALFREAGLELSRFHEVAPAFTPNVAFDTRHAWSGSEAALPETTVTVEAALWRGKLTSFIVRFPWMKAPETSESPTTLSDTGFGLFTCLLLATGLFCAVFFARRNLSAGRGDRSGALRLALAAFVLYTVKTAADTHVIPALDLVNFEFINLSVGVALCGLLWLSYIALEPAVRARWPHSLITWNRLLAGQFRDPRLGSHILMGAVLGVAMRYGLLWFNYWLVARGKKPVGVDLDLLMGVRAVLSTHAGTLFQAIMAGSVIFFLLCGLRALVRRDWGAALAASVLLTFSESDMRTSTNLALDVPIYIVIYFVLAWLTLRMGLVPVILTMFVVNTISRMPVGSDFNAWYNPITVVQAGVIATIALYGFWRSQSEARPAAE